MVLTRIHSLLLVLIALPILAGGQDLGAIARAKKAEKEKKPSGKVLTNEDLGKQGNPLSPQTYSYTYETTGASPRTVQVTRDGNRETVEITGGGRHFSIYDLDAKQVYAKASRASAACTVAPYNLPAFPAGDDPVGAGPGGLHAWSAEGTVHQLGPEVMNGIPAMAMEVSSGEERTKVWVARDGGFPMKVVSVRPDGTGKTLFEIKQLSFEKPPAARLVPPGNCVQKR